MDASHSCGRVSFLLQLSDCDCYCYLHSARNQRKRLRCYTEFVVPLMRPVAPQQKASRHWYGISAETGVETALWNGLTDSDDEGERWRRRRPLSKSMLAPTEDLVALHCLSLVLV